MGNAEEEALELRLAAELQDAISQEGGLQYQEISELGTLMALPQVLRQLNDFSTAADQLLAVRKSVRQAVSAITRPQQVLRRGRVWSQELIAPTKFREAISHLLNEIDRPLKSSGKQRRDHVIGLLELGIAVTSMRRRGVGPEFELMRVLARSLIVLRRSPVTFERIKVRYSFIEETDSPHGVRLEGAHVSCDVRALRECQTFEDTGFYLIPWKGVLAPKDALTQSLDSGLAHYSDYAPGEQITTPLKERTIDQDRSPILTVPFEKIWQLTKRKFYYYDIEYPRGGRSACARPGDENYKLIATPTGSMSGSVSVEVTTPRPVEISAVGHPHRVIFNAHQTAYGTYHSIYEFDSLHAGQPFGLVIHWNDEAGRRDREFRELASDPKQDVLGWVAKEGAEELAVIFEVSGLIEIEEP
ncbi:hypothetical protein [Streptomyces sp. cg40]|uniref:hypothetical protein n=1 Tax=Streptomyces sp. cg40 TaxID=3419764 RepID=UPI003D06875E